MNFTNAELSWTGGEREAMLACAQLAKSVAWIADKPPDFHAPTRQGGEPRH